MSLRVISIFFLSQAYLKLAFEFVFKGLVSLGQPTRP